MSLITASAACLLNALVRVKGLALAWSCLFGLAAGPVFPTIMSAAMDAHPGHTGRASNLLLTFAGIFGMASNIGLGTAMDAFGMGNSFYMVAAFAALGAVLFFVAGGKAKKKGIAL